LRRGLCETIGQSLASEIVEGNRQFVVVPKTPGTEGLAKKMSARARKAGIEIALVDARGNVFNVP
jgi:sulfate adenylyltransferase subunit 1 (EFTu-like GTPase family)